MSLHPDPFTDKVQHAVQNWLCDQPKKLLYGGMALMNCWKMCIEKECDCAEK
jgi:hypothetical protein